MKGDIAGSLSEIQQRLDRAELLKDEVEVANRRAGEVHEEIAAIEEQQKALSGKEFESR